MCVCVCVLSLIHILSFRCFPPRCVYLDLPHLKDHVLFFYSVLFHMIRFFCSCLSSSALLNKSPLYCVVLDGNIFRLFEVYSFQSSILPSTKNTRRRQRLMLIFIRVSFDLLAVTVFRAIFLRSLTSLISQQGSIKQLKYAKCQIYKTQYVQNSQVFKVIYLSLIHI